MKLLDKELYIKLVNPLSKVKINNLFARSVIEHHVTGKVYVDNANTPRTIYVVHPYGMSLLFGDPLNDAFNKEFKEYALNFNKIRHNHEWMQAYPDSWDKKLHRLFEGYLIEHKDNSADVKTGIIELNTRVNFKFNKEKYLARKHITSPHDFRIVRTDREIFKEMKGKVIPYHFWDNADDFLDRGVGFSLIYKNQLATTAYVSFIHDDKLELGIETMPEFRGKGFAQLTCASLINYCIRNKYEPVWACSLENSGSYKLAQKLGFEPVVKIPYYRLSN
jgi:RimJ/RimL family protein N-acetyltransferase